MKTVTKLLVLILAFSVLQPQSVFAQDTLKIFRYPAVDLIDVLVTAHVSLVEPVFRYQYEIRSLATSEQHIWAVDIPFYMLPTNVQSPFGWFAIVGGRTPVIGWGSDDSLYNIHPNQVLSSFSYDSEGIPGIIIIYLRGWTEPPELTFDPDSTVGEDVLEASRKVSTIGAVIPPSPFLTIIFLDTLLSYTTQSRSLGWITSQTTADKYTGYFSSAKSSLQAGNINAARLTLQQVLNDVNVDSSSTLTSEAYALLRYNTEYLLSQLPEQESGISTYSLFATHSMHLQQNSDVYSGDIGVNAAGSPPFLDEQLELSIGISTTTPAGYAVKANRIKVKNGSVVNSNVYYNELDNNGTITGSQNTPLQLPLVTALPEFKSATPGTENFDIPQNGTLTLQPGSYGDILVRKNGVLTLTGGTYHLNSFTTGDDVQLIFQAPTEVRIAGKFDSGQGSYIGPQDTTTMTADQIIFYVTGINGTNGNLGATPKAAKIGIGNTVWANFYAPNG
ncbi:MAG TPA: hypothetical protein VII11_08215, partial [Bacteroidota bacterium]